MTILVVDDEIGRVGSLQQKSFLRNYDRLPYVFRFESGAAGNGYDPAKAASAVESESEIDLVLLDLKFGSDDSLMGLEILRRLTSRYPNLPVLIMSGKDRDVDLLGRCLEDGAVGFVEKHRSPEYLKTSIDRAFELMRSHVLLGQSAPLRDLRRQAARLSPYDQIPVLIVGERGTGKERVARYIHQSGPRRQGPFVAVNCAGVPESLFEGEFFGSEKGAYTGSVAQRIGYLERAHGGTLFLDEVGTLPLSMQTKLLRALEERSFFRLGADAGEIRSNFQLLSATNADPQQLIRERKLREDFFDRIAAVMIHTPPLRNCLSDVRLLAEHFVKRLVGERKRLASSTIRVLSRQIWPGNVRQLERVVQEAVVRSEDADAILPAHLPAWLLQSQITPPAFSESSETPAVWEKERLGAELRLALRAKREIQLYKGRHWKAEFMRTVYPHCKAQNAKGFSDLVKRLTQGPWGDPSLRLDQELADLLEQLEA